MSKIIIIPNSQKMIKDTLDYAAGYIIGIEGLSVNLPTYFDINKIESIIKLLNKHKKEVFIALNKNMHNSDIKALEKTLLLLDKMNITGILYYDISIVNLKKKLNLKTDLVWSQEHLTTNSVTSNYWYDFGAKYTYLSSEITLNEILEIKKEAKSKIMVTILGYIPMFTSKRNLVRSYLKTFNMENKDNRHFMTKEGLTYPVIDDKLGTTVYSSYFLNGINEYAILNKHKIDYLVLNSFLINTSKMLQILQIFKEINQKNIGKSKERIDKLLENTSEGFLYTETIYKVKKND